MVRIRVVLPEPDGPMMLITSRSPPADRCLSAPHAAPGFANAPQIERRRRAVDGRGVALFAQRRQALAQRPAFRLAEGLRTLTLNIETIFQRPVQPVKTVTTIT